MKCIECGKEFYVPPCRIKAGRKFCDKNCRGKNKEIRKKQSEARKKNNPGGFKKRKHKLNISQKEYNTLHHWIIRNFEKSDTCEKCNKTGLKGKYINWANKTGIYDRQRKNWMRLCRKCHYWHDYKKDL